MKTASCAKHTIDVLCFLLAKTKLGHTVKLHQEKVAQLLSYLVTKTDSVMPSWVLNDTTKQHASPA